MFGGDKRRVRKELRSLSEYLQYVEEARRLLANGELSDSEVEEVHKGLVAVAELSLDSMLKIKEVTNGPLPDELVKGFSLMMQSESCYEAIRHFMAFQELGPPANVLDQLGAHAMSRVVVLAGAHAISVYFVVKESDSEKKAEAYMGAIRGWLSMLPVQRLEELANREDPQFVLDCWHAEDPWHAKIMAQLNLID